MNSQRIVLKLKDFWLIFENKMALIAIFPIFILNFSSHSYYGCVIATVCKLLGRYKKSLLENMVFGVCVCMCAHWLGGLNLLWTLCSKYYSR